MRNRYEEHLAMKISDYGLIHSTLDDEQEETDSQSLSCVSIKEGGREDKSELSRAELSLFLIPLPSPFKVSPVPSIHSWSIDPVLRSVLLNYLPVLQSA